LSAVIREKSHDRKQSPSSDRARHGTDDKSRPLLFWFVQQIEQFDQVKAYAILGARPRDWLGGPQFGDSAGYLARAPAEKILGLKGKLPEIRIELGMVTMINRIPFYFPLTKVRPWLTLIVLVSSERKFKNGSARNTIL
jgi:hypothetical protein